MRRFLALSNVAVACAIVAPLAFAGGPKQGPAKGLPKHLGNQLCQPVALLGQVSSVASDSFVVDVAKANRHALVGPARTVSVGAATRFQIGNVRGALSDLASGQPVLVAGRACRAGTDFTLTARLVLAKATPQPVDPSKVPTNDGGEGGLDSGLGTTPSQTTPTTAGGDEGSIS